MSTLLRLIAFILLCTACDRPPSGKTIFRAAFLRVTNDDRDQPLSIAIAFPKCSHETPFGSGTCRRLLCNVVVANRTRDQELEKIVCEDAEERLIPLLLRVTSKDGCYDTLLLYATQLLKAHDIDPASFLENGSIEPRIKLLPRSIREAYGDHSPPSEELRQVWAL
jgi:hypothetical protein